ncbi:DUF4365 domain-containing protein [Priestia aryabhattai]|uniref:DUF4365 domain-containing protein n=1 Tax=Priestia aryabhattai TaxID=412384 RepID=UPI00367081FD
MSVTENQLRGYMGEFFVAYRIVHNGKWIARTEQNDQGIDIEAQLVKDMEAKPWRMKVQVKTTQGLTRNNRQITFSSSDLTKKYITKFLGSHEAIILCIVDVDEENNIREVYYEIIKEWVEENKKYFEKKDMDSKVTIKIPDSQTLDFGLNGELTTITEKPSKPKEQLMKLILETTNEKYKEILSNIMNDKTAFETRISVVVEKIKQPLNDIDSVNELVNELKEKVRNYGHRFNIEDLKDILSIIKYDTRLIAKVYHVFGILYDMHPSKMKKLMLPKFFYENKYHKLAYYCFWREYHINKGRNTEKSLFTYSLIQGSEVNPHRYSLYFDLRSRASEINELVDYYNKYGTYAITELFQQYKKK